MGIGSDHTAHIFARGGSKGIIGKNIKIAGGKPLLVHSIETALESEYISKVVVSTDCDKIAKVAEKNKAVVLTRPTELANDTVSELLAWRHAIENNSTYFLDQHKKPLISVPPTSPLRNVEDIDKAIEKYYQKKFDAVIGISPAHQNPYLSMVKIKDSQLLEIAVEGSKAYRRQDTPDIYNVTSCIYVANPEFILVEDKLLNGEIGYIKIPPHRALDIDEPFDLYLADLMLRFPFKG